MKKSELSLPPEKLKHFEGKYSIQMLAKGKILRFSWLKEKQKGLLLK